MFQVVSKDSLNLQLAGESISWQWFLLVNFFYLKFLLMCYVEWKYSEEFKSKILNFCFQKYCFIVLVREK